MAEGQQQKGRFQWRWIILTGAIVLSLIFLIPFIQEGGARVNTSVIVETEEAFVGSIQETAEGLAQVTEAKSRWVRTNYSGLIASLEAEEGQRVKKGDVIAQLDEQELEEQVNGLLDELEALDEQIAEADDSTSAELTAGASGLVKAVYVRRGDRSDRATERSGGLLEISGDGLLQVEVPLWEGAEPGGNVTVTIDGHQEPGEVSELDREQGLIVITFSDKREYALGAEAVVSTEETELGRGPLASHDPWLLTVESSIVSEVEAEVGDRVEQGDLLMRCILEEQNNAYQALREQRDRLVRELFALQEYALDPVIRAETEGLVRDLRAEEGDTLAAGDRVCRVVSENSFYAEVRIRREEAARLRPGQEVVLSTPNAVNKGRLVSLSLPEEEEPGLSLVRVKVSLDHTEGVALGSEGSCTIILASANNAVLVPAEAVKTMEDGSKAVEISYGDGLNRFNEVQTGLEDGTYVQILKGVDEGEDVVVSSQVVKTHVVEFLGREWVIEEEN